MLTTLEYVTDDVTDSQQDPHQRTPQHTARHRRRLDASQDHRRWGAAPMVLGSCGGGASLGSRTLTGSDFAACPFAARSRCATATAGRSATCGSPSPTAATSAASTACRPRGCRGSTASEILTFEEIERLVRLFVVDGSQRRAAHRRRAARAPGAAHAGRDAERDRRPRGPLADHQRLPARAAWPATSRPPACGASTCRSTRSRVTGSSR